MRLDARTGDQGWQCYDVQRAALVPTVSWVDTGSATWGEYACIRHSICPADFDAELPQVVHYERRIDILFEQRMVLFNAIEDGEPASHAALIEKLAELTL